MRKVKFVFGFLFTICLFLIGCKKKSSKKTLNAIDSTSSINEIKNDTMKFSNKSIGNKLANLIDLSIHYPSGHVHYDIGDIFFDQANSSNGVLSKLVDHSGKKLYLDNYYISYETIEQLFAEIKGLVGINFSFVEIKKSDYETKLDLNNAADVVLFFVATPIIQVDPKNLQTKQGEKYFLFNLKSKFDIKDNITTVGTQLINDYKITKTKKILDKYYSHMGKGNTIAIYYSSEDIKQLLSKKMGLNFNLAEIVNSAKVQKVIIDRKLDAEKYNNAYGGRNGQIIIIGKYIDPSSRTIFKGDYFDMGSLQP